MKKLATLTMVLAFVVGCKKTEEMAPAIKNEDKAGAPKMAEPVPAAGGAKTELKAFPAGNYDVDASHSAIIFKAKHFGVGYTYGWFRDFSGKYTVDSDVSKQQIEITVKTDSVDSRDEKRDAHLKGPDFFNSAQFPTITFKSTKVEDAGDGTLNVTGDLTLRGTTKPITAKFSQVGTGEDPYKNTRTGYEAKLTINRMDYGVAFMPEGVSTDVELTIAFEGILKK